MGYVYVVGRRRKGTGVDCESLISFGFKCSQRGFIWFLTVFLLTSFLFRQVSLSFASTFFLAFSFCFPLSRKDDVIFFPFQDRDYTQI